MDKETGATTVVKDTTKTPTNRFPPDRFKKLYEQATVKVITI